jgi:hypothetical protein
VLSENKFTFNDRPSSSGPQSGLKDDLYTILEVAMIAGLSVSRFQEGKACVTFCSELSSFSGAV